MTFWFIFLGGFTLVFWLEIPRLLLEYAAAGSSEIRQFLGM